MDVRFSGGRGLNTLDSESLLQSMTVEQNRLDLEYRSKLDNIITQQKHSLREYLFQNHPGLDMPVDGPHSHFVMNCLKEFAILSLELAEDTNNQIEDGFTEFVEVVHPELQRYDKFVKNYNGGKSTLLSSSLDLDDYEVHIGKRKKWLDDIQKSSDAIVLKEMNLDKMIRKITARYGKLMGVERKVESGHEAVEEEADAVLGILMEGVVPGNRNLCEDHANFLNRLDMSREFKNSHKMNLLKGMLAHRVSNLKLAETELQMKRDFRLKEDNPFVMPLSHGTSLSSRNRKIINLDRD